FQEHASVPRSAVAENMGSPGAGADRRCGACFLEMSSHRKRSTAEFAASLRWRVHYMGTSADNCQACHAPGLVLGSLGDHRARHGADIRDAAPYILLHIVR